MQIFSSAILSAGLLRILVIAGQPVQDSSDAEDFCFCEIREKLFLEDSTDEVDVAIVLAADMSGSINDTEAALQRESYASALESADVLKVIKEGMHGRIAVTFVEWSSFGSLETRVDWAILSDANDASFIAEAIRRKSERERSAPHGSKTSISYAIDVSVVALDKLPVPTLRRIIDISGDGTNNDGSSLEDSRRRALQKAIVINGLPIGAEVENGETTTEYYERHVIGGPGSFVIPANSSAEFHWAIINKLVRELSSISGEARS
ncbi:DUF1194 domain-containing protein [Mesorhizobium sp. WSM4303]|uniref:DUF1194 domain-containing protein n=1 Tax=unclassified Mesorhizobium TaxID=325217 RepID=UPI00115EFCBF|nr:MULTISPECIES: DUF1194 domain-containing protein [unclassified Mesorhizobium]TRC92712.1 DUF1194 domain-containing protein [Mesorhizobium sp. WSM4306]TRC93207.1 DUF1194 domain-containing protein [Mesorhizobium sp. WSM4303]